MTLETALSRQSTLPHMKLTQQSRALPNQLHWQCEFEICWILGILIQLNKVVDGPDLYVWAFDLFKSLATFKYDLKDQHCWWRSKHTFKRSPWNVSSIRIIWYGAYKAWLQWMQRKPRMAVGEHDYVIPLQCNPIQCDAMQCHAMSCNKDKDKQMRFKYQTNVVFLEGGGSRISNIEFEPKNAPTF